MTDRAVNSPNFDLLGDNVLEPTDPLLSESDYEAVFGLEKKIDENLLPNEGDPLNDRISGQGDITDENCGKISSVYVTEQKECRHTRFSCKRQGCPECFRLWARRISQSSGEYLIGVAKINSRHLYHYSVSRGAGGDDSFESLEATFRECVDKFQSWKDTIVAIVRHPRTIKCKDCGFHPDNHSLPESCPSCGGKMTWVWFKYHHLHVITDFKFPLNRKDDFIQWEKENNVIVNNISVKTKSYITGEKLGIPEYGEENKEILRKIINYELGHALFVPGKQKQAIRYFGMSAKTNYRMEVKKIKEPVVSPLGLNYYLIMKECWRIGNDDNLHVDKCMPTIEKNCYFIYHLDYWGERIPLTTTKLEGTVIPLRYFNRALCKWMRAVPPRNHKKEPVRKPVVTIPFVEKFSGV